MNTQTDSAASGTEEHLLQWLQDLLGDTPEAIAEIRQAITAEPGRINHAYRELLSGYRQNPEELIQVTSHLKGKPYPGLVTASDVPFLSLCIHHFLPFHGFIDVVYEPGEFILGIGKIPRIVQCHARRFQIQEFLVQSIADDFMTLVKAKGVFVRSKATHLCVCHRGPNSQATFNTVTYSLGSLKDASHQEQLFINGNQG